MAYEIKFDIVLQGQKWESEAVFPTKEKAYYAAHVLLQSGATLALVCPGDKETEQFEGVSSGVPLDYNSSTFSREATTVFPEITLKTIICNSQIAESLMMDLESL